jgi:hypothetical protein
MKQASKSCLVFIARTYNIAIGYTDLAFFDAYVYFPTPVTSAALQLKQKRHEQNLLSTMYSLDRHVCQRMEEALGTNKMMSRELQLHI